MKPAVLFVCLALLSAGGCSILPGTGPSESEVVAQRQAGDEIRFDVVEVDDRVVTSLLAQQQDRTFARFEKDGSPPELKIAIGDTIAVTLWESAAGGLFSEPAPDRSFTPSRPGIEPLAPESRPPQPAAPGGSNLPFESPFGTANPPIAAPQPSTGRPPGGTSTTPRLLPSGDASIEGSNRRSATIPDQPVGADGAISVPYAGRVAVTGRTPAEAQQAIEALLAGKALDPQALVIVKKSAVNAVTVAGEVVAGAKVPLSPGGDRLLQVIAAAGGARAPVYETFVRLSRGGLTATIPLERLVADPDENIYARPGDVLTLVRVPQTFSVFGATGRNAVIGFDAETITVSQALAKSQGLRDDLANPKGVFLFRYEPIAVVHALGEPMARRAPDGISPVVYRFDFADASTFHLADRFPVRDKDIIFVADAAAAQINKLFTVFSTVTGPFITGIVTCHYAKC
jgi:protein involved in polysaccharide export with SLBB domain